MKILFNIVFACVFLAVSCVSSHAIGRSMCFPIETLRESFQVVYPNARQVTMEGDAARAYLAEYNSFGRPTKFAGDTLFMNILQNGTTMLIPLNDGIGCSRMIVGPKLHKVIMNKVKRGSV